MDDFLTVKITSPEKVIWEGRAEAVSSENAEGPFDILPEHANFITLIKEKPIIIHRSDGKRDFTFDRAVIYMKENEVTVYANLGADVEIEEPAVEEAEDEAQSEQVKTDSRAEKKAAPSRGTEKARSRKGVPQ